MSFYVHVLISRLLRIIVLCWIHPKCNYKINSVEYRNYTYFPLNEVWGHRGKYVSKYSTYIYLGTYSVHVHIYICI